MFPGGDTKYSSSTRAAALKTVSRQFPSLTVSSLTINGLQTEKTVILRKVKQISLIKQLKYFNKSFKYSKVD